MPYRILVVDDDNAVRFGLSRHLERHDFVVSQAATSAAARASFDVFKPDAVVTDFRLPDGDAFSLIEDFRKARPSLPIIVFTGFGTIELAVKAIRLGADNLLTKPVDLEEFVKELSRACSSATARVSGTHAIAKVSRPGPKMAALLDEIERLKDSECTLLVLGETGTGKTRLVRDIHESSRRSRERFVDLNCAGLAKDLVESELFGHERGAFTSAHSSKAGLFELADGGTLFLDEIGDIDLAVQAKLLKAIEEKRFRRLGASRESSSDVRIVAATHRDLREAVRANEFRSDLYYRLSAVTITLPALRERPGDILDLAQGLIASLCEAMGRPVPDLSVDAEAALTAHAWPGNIRELKNVLERALHFTRDERIYAADLRMESGNEPAARTARAPSASTLRDLERAHIERAIVEHGCVIDAARSLGISRSSMYLKLKAYGMYPSRGFRRRSKAGGEGDL